MWRSRSGSYVHVTNIYPGFTQDGADAPNHAGLIGVAAEEDVAFRHKFSPIAADANDTRFIMHDRSTYHLYIVVARAWCSREGGAIAIGIQKAYGDEVGKLGRYGRFLFDDLQSPLFCQQRRIDHVDMRI